MGQYRHPAEWMQLQIGFGELCERIDLDRLVLDRLQTQRQSGDPVIDAVSVSMQVDRIRHLRLYQPFLSG
jgi:hypothetical protein